jgi:hypothetical protein
MTARSERPRNSSIARILCWIAIGNCFRLDAEPDDVSEGLPDEQNEGRKASEMYLIRDKAVRFSAKERDGFARAKPADRVEA